MIFMLLIMLTTAIAQDEPWRENMKHMTYSPRFFGPNAFPLPELRSGYIENSWEVEVRGEYHTYPGDQTKNIYTRLFIPIAQGRAGFEFSYTFLEYYNMTPETVAERHASGQSWREGTKGDVIFSSFYNFTQHDRRSCLLFEATLKTTSGKRLSDARHTDAAAYWFDLNAGYYLFGSTHSTSFLRLQALVGFYCWMTNDIMHRQNDAFLFSAGSSAGYKNLTIQADIAGFYGYLNNGDRPFMLRTKLNYEYKKNIFSLRYKHGIHDFFYDTYSLAYIRRF